MIMTDLLSFKGRVGRGVFVLIQAGVFIALYLATFILIVATGAGDERQAAITVQGTIGVAFGGCAFGALAAWVSLAAAVRRCHDRDLSGWMLLFAFPPVLGQLWLFLNLITGPGTPGANAYGPPRFTFSQTALSLAPA